MLCMRVGCVSAPLSAAFGGPGAGQMGGGGGRATPAGTGSALERRPNCMPTGASLDWPVRSTGERGTELVYIFSIYVVGEFH